MNIRPFDAYEIAPVVQSANGICEQYGSLLEAQEAMQAGDTLIWSVFGHLPEGGLECIADFATEDGAVTLLYRICGRLVPLCGGAQIVRTGALESDVQAAIRASTRFHESRLDSLVHDVASSLASDANNGGRESQVRFLMAHGVGIADLLKAA